jgi:hypothetical protein
MLRFAPVLLLLSAGPLRADTTLLGVGTLPGNAMDAAPADARHALGGLGSAIAWTGRGNTFYMLADSGPHDRPGWQCRVHTVEIAAAPGEVKLKLASTTLLTTETDQPLIGAFPQKGPAKGVPFDPEGMRVGPKGTLFIADEHGPSVGEFDERGKRLRSFALPAKFLPKKLSGRQPNRGFEGLALSPDGKKLFALLQSPLIQDGGAMNQNGRSGVNCRLLELEIATGRSREFVYVLDSADHGCNEILAITDRAFLVIERDHIAGKDAKLKRIMRIDLAGATDVSAVERLPAGSLPATIAPVKKTLFLDLLDPKFKLAGRDLPEKFEGLALGPDLPDGRKLLLISTDNDFQPAAPTRVYAFAIDAADLK